MKIERVSPQVVVARHHGIAWVHVAQAVPPKGAIGIHRATTHVLGRMRQLFSGVGVRFDQVVRTWLYVGGILELERRPTAIQRIQPRRSDFYRDTSFLADRLSASADVRRGPAYPASTGIGTADRGLVGSAIALDAGQREIRAAALENPQQTAAYDYDAAYSPQSPKFSRAMALSCGAHATIFVSGTASITASETRHAGDPVAQTHQTLDNIAALICEENLARHEMAGLGASLASLGLVRVYVKRQEDYAAVREACRQRLGEAPMIFAQADICREDLLVEIEAVAFSRWASVPRSHRAAWPELVKGDCGDFREAGGEPSASALRPPPAGEAFGGDRP